LLDSTLFERSVKSIVGSGTWVEISRAGLRFDRNGLLILLECFEGRKGFGSKCLLHVGGERRRRFRCGNAVRLRTIAIDYHFVLFIDL
jgi:hypothetical protein